MFCLKDLGVEGTHNWMINLVKRGTSQTYQEGVGKSFMHTLKSTGREGMASGNCEVVKGIIPFDGCACIV